MFVFVYGYFSRRAEQLSLLFRSFDHARRFRVETRLNSEAGAGECQNIPVHGYKKEVVAALHVE